MSLWPILWAINSAPVADAEERLILVALADRASSDGTDAYPSKKSIAQVALIDPKTVQRRLRSLMQRGLIVEGNQEAAQRIPEHFRPTVYDLMIPCSWWSPGDLERVNAERVGRGLQPLTPEDRPDLGAAPPRKARADKGKRRTKPQPDGGTASPRGEDSESPGQTGQEGGTTSPGGGDYKSLTGGLQDPQTSPCNPPLEPSPSSGVAADGDSAAALVAGLEEGGGGGDAPQQEEKNTAAAGFVDALPYAGRRPDRDRRERMISLAAAALAAGWSEPALRVQVTSETESAKSLAAVYEHRLSPAKLPVSPPPPKQFAVPSGGGDDRPKCSRCGSLIKKSAAVADELCKECREGKNLPMPVQRGVPAANNARGAALARGNMADKAVRPRV